MLTKDANVCHAATGSAIPCNNKNNSVNGVTHKGPSTPAQPGDSLVPCMKAASARRCVCARALESRLLPEDLRLLGSTQLRQLWGLPLQPWATSTTANTTTNL